MSAYLHPHTPSPGARRDPSPAADARVGMVLERRYHVRSVLGRGGMSSVYLGEDRRLRRAVALKMVRLDKSYDPAEQLRLQTEAEHMARLSSPRVVGVHELLVLPDGQRCAVLELVQGVSLAGLLARRRLRPVEATHIATEACRALGDLHDHGLLHLDVKPANILLGRNRAIKLADLGLALPMSSRHVVDPGRNSGTLPYMPREQLDGDLLYPPSDLYSLGVLYYEMLTGRVPVRGQSFTDYAQAHAQGKVLEAVRRDPSLPGTCRPFLARALASPAWQRFAEARIMLRDLQELRRALEAAEPAG